MYTVTYLQPNGTLATYPLNNGQRCIYKHSTPQGHHLTESLNARSCESGIVSVTYLQPDGTPATYPLNNGKPCDYDHSTPQGHHFTRDRDAQCYDGRGCGIFTVTYLQSNGTPATYPLNNGKPCCCEYSTPQNHHITRDLIVPYRKTSRDGDDDQEQKTLLYNVTYLQPDGTPATYPLNNGKALLLQTLNTTRPPHYKCPHL